jgi:hypothetical protein
MSLQSQFDGFGAANGQRQTGQLADVPTQAEARQCAIPTRRYPGRRRHASPMRGRLWTVNGRALGFGGNLVIVPIRLLAFRTVPSFPDYSFFVSEAVGHARRSCATKFADISGPLAVEFSFKSGNARFEFVHLRRNLLQSLPTGSPI